MPQEYIPASDRYLSEIDESGLLTLGSRLKRLSELCMNQCSTIYKTHEINFKPVWFPILLALYQHGEMDIKSLADKRRITHSAASQIIKDLANNKLVAYTTDSKDARQKNISLSKKGEKQLIKLVPFLQTMENGLSEAMGDKAQTLLSSLEFLENQLKANPVYEQKLAYEDNIEITLFEDKYAEAFYNLNRSWLEKYFVVEPIDEQKIANPKDQVLKKGGEILFAIDDQKAIGTAALVPVDKKKDRIELSKMAVDESYQGRGIGNKLILAAIDKSKELGYKYLYLESNSKLKAAISLYRKHGFEDVEVKNSPYLRCNIAMIKSLT